jgi:hypothetical protein
MWKECGGNEGEIGRECGRNVKGWWIKGGYEVDERWV